MNKPELETRKAMLVESINEMAEDSKYVLCIRRDLDSEYEECTAGAEGSLEDILRSIGEIIKAVIKDSDYSAAQCMMLSKEINTAISHAVAKASAEMLSAKDPGVAIAELKELLDAALGDPAADEPAEPEADD